MNKILLTILIGVFPIVIWGKQLNDKQYIYQRIDVREGLSYQVNCMTVSHPYRLCLDGYQKRYRTLRWI